MCRVLRAFALLLFLYDNTLAADAIRDAVVQLHVTQRTPDFYRPWTKSGPSKSSGSGAIIEGNRILTNAHVVQYASQVFVQLHQGGDRLPAKVVAIAPRIDLAVVELEDPNVIADIEPLTLSDDMPMIKSTVNVYGYPMGGEDISVTEGIVSRIEYTRYYLDGSGLRIQVDAALNPGNSGGPAITDGKIVGLVFSKIDEGENIGYLIPVEEIQIFLKDIADGDFDGKPCLHGQFATAENDALRAWLKLSADQTGMIVSEPYREDDPYPLQRWDVITAIGPHNIDNQGYVIHNEDLRLQFTYFADKLCQDGSVELTIWRDGESMQVSVPVAADRDLVLAPLRNDYPRYFIYGPVVFSPGTQELMRGLSSSSRWTKYLAGLGNPLVARMYDAPAFEGEELVIIATRLFPHRVSKGYDRAEFGVITHLNAEPIKNFRHLAELLANCQDEFVRFRVAGRNESLVFNRSEMEAATEEVLTDEGIRYQCSEDLRDIWE